MAFFSPMADIGLIAFVLAIVSQALQRKFLDKKKMKEHQDTIKEKQSKIKELASKNDVNLKSEIEKLELETMETMNLMMKNSLRHMVVTFIIIIPAFWWIGSTYAGTSVKMPFPLPVMHRDFSFEITQTLGWFWYYFYASLVSSLVLNALMNVLEKNDFVRAKILKK